MSIKLIDGTPYTEEMQMNSTLVFFRTPNNNVVIINDAVLNIKDIILKEEDFKFISTIHESGGKISEIEFTEDLIDGGFEDTASGISFHPKLETIEKLEKHHLGTIVFKDGKVSSSHYLIGLDDKFLLTNLATLDAIVVEDDRDYTIQRIRIDTGDKLPAVLKACRVEVGPMFIDEDM